MRLKRNRFGLDLAVLFDALIDDYPSHVSLAVIGTKSPAFCAEFDTLYDNLCDCLSVYLSDLRCLYF